MQRMRNNNLEIRIAGSSFRPQQFLNQNISVKLNVWNLRQANSSRGPT